MNIAGDDINIQSSTITPYSGDNTILDPGESGSIQFNLINLGLGTVNNVTAKLRNFSNYIEITDSLATFGTITPNGQANNAADPFAVEASIQAIPGMQVPLSVDFYTNNQLIETEKYTLTIGSPSITTPLGPDNYGYVCYDMGDTSFPDCPQYSWIEIDPSLGGSGTSIGIADNGNNGQYGDNEDSTAVKSVALPFSFSFYGKTYNEISVCSNGFIGVGHSRVNDFRNWYIPGPGGPSPMIAPFWDDLTMTTGSGIYSYYDASSHYFVIEWSKMKNRYPRDSSPSNHAEETFQVLLYDQAYYPTSTNDGPIKFQYKTFNNVDANGYEEHFNYSTIGIEDHTGNVGLQYSFDNLYPVSASPLTNNSAIYFSTLPINSEQPLLFIQGTSTQDGNNNIIESGDLIHLGISLNNVGQQVANNVHINISSDDPFVTMITNTSTYPNIDGNSHASNLQDILLRVSSECPDAHIIPLSVTIYCGNLNWVRTVLLTVQKPTITIGDLLINDSNGNNNGVIDIGETATIILSLVNDQSIDMNNIVAHLIENNSYFSFADTVLTVAKIPANTTLQLPVTVQISSSAQQYASLPFTVRLSGAIEMSRAMFFLLGTNGMSHDFENDNGSMVSTPASGWSWGVPATGAHSGTKCWAVRLSGQYPTNVTYILDSAPITIGGNASLSFYHHFDTEADYDGGCIQISTNNGQDFKHNNTK